MRKENRMKRNPLKRSAKTASKHQARKAGPDGLSCIRCNPNSGKLIRRHKLGPEA